jgi:uncharacterized BrkB/YihY/UPF0761 family membrane protein
MPDAVTYGGLVTVAALEALEPFRKEASMPFDAHPFLASNIWAYLPITILSIVGLIWLWRLLPQRHEAPRNGVFNRDVLTHIIGQQFQSTTVVLDGYFL